MRRFCWVTSIVGSVFGAVIVIEAFAFYQSSPQQILVNLLVGLSVSIIPYCLARSVSEIMGPKT